MNNKAASEITIRQALSELDIWTFETYFSTINHVDSKNQTIRIISDFKTIFNSVNRIFLHKMKFMLFNIFFCENIYYTYEYK